MSGYEGRIEDEGYLWERVEELPVSSLTKKYGKLATDLTDSTD
jgi:hypothetical protein